MKEPEKVSFDSMPPLITGLFLTKEQEEKLKEPFKDVVSVIRCKDCEIRGNINLCPLAYIEKTEQFAALCVDEWFCGNGKRKSD
jgi:hypothetical protein